MKTLNQNEILAVSGATLTEDAQTQLTLDVNYIGIEMVKGAIIGSCLSILSGNWKTIVVSIAAGALIGGGLVAAQYGANELNNRYNLI